MIYLGNLTTLTTCMIMSTDDIIFKEKLAALPLSLPHRL